MTSSAPIERIPEFDLGDRMEKARTVAGIPVARIAEHFDVRRQTVGNWLAGRTQPSRAVLMQWALMTSVPLRWLETGEAAPAEADAAGALLPRLDSNQKPFD